MLSVAMLQDAEPAHNYFQTLPRILHTLKQPVQGPCTPCWQSFTVLVLIIVAIGEMNNSNQSWRRYKILPNSATGLTSFRIYFWAHTADLFVFQGHGNACPLFSGSHGIPLIPDAFCHLAHEYEVWFQNSFHVSNGAQTSFKDNIPYVHGRIAY